MNVEFTDNSAEILAALHAAAERGLEETGQTAEKYAVLKTPTDTGRLKNSMTHLVQDDTVCIGSNVEYAVYVEYGTGRFASTGNGRPGWWVYVSDPDGGGKRKTNAERRIYTEQEARQIMAILRKKGLDAHMTQGMQPVHMLRDAVSNHIDQYKRIIERALKNE